MNPLSYFPLVNPPILLILLGITGHILIQWLPVIHKNKIILTLSTLFYLTVSPLTAWIPLYSTLIIYFFPFKITSNQPKSRYWTALGIALLIAPFFFFKYLFDMNADHSHTILDKIWLPVGISFFTFQAISYLVDVSRASHPPEKKFLNLFSYILFFPKMIAGPIERAKPFLTQLHNCTKPSLDTTRSSIWLVSLGILKKFIMADTLFYIVNPVLNNPSGHSIDILLLIILLARYQLYFDFSGYTDIARGVAKSMNIDLMDNFKQPFRATSISGFWQRWHISLSSWMRDYIFYPLALNLKMKASIFIAIIISFLVLGLWHGATLNFILYGLIQGIAVSLHQIIKAKLDRKLNPNNRWITLFRSTFGWLATYCIIVFPTILLFWLADINKVNLYFLEIYKSLSSESDADSIMTFFSFRGIVIISILIISELSVTVFNQHRFKKVLLKVPGWVRWVAYFILIAIAYIFFPVDFSVPFRYSNF